PPPQVRDEPFEAYAERILGRRLLAASGALVRPLCARRAVEDQLTDLLRKPPERHGEVDAERPAQGPERFAHEPAVPFRPWRDRPLLQRQRFVGHEASRVEIVGGAQPLALGAGA